MNETAFPTLRLLPIVILTQIAPRSSFLVVLPQTVFIEGTGDLLQDVAT
jgi:hypothetical protein